MREETRHDGAAIARLGGLLDELIGRLSPFPTPWGIRVGLAARGIDIGPLPLPVTPLRKEQITAFTKWLPAWLQRNDLAQAHPGTPSEASRS